MKQPKTAPADSKAALLQAAKRVFSEKGFDGATVKDLADEAGVNISMVSYYFGGKEGLYRTSLESFGLERVEATERILKEPTSVEDFKLRLKIFAEGFFDIHRTEPEICKIIHHGLLGSDKILLDLFNSVFNRIFLALHNFVIAAQRKGLLKEKLDTEITTGLMFGALMNFINADELRKLTCKRTLEEPAFCDSVIEHWVESYTGGIFARHENQNEK